MLRPHVDIPGFLAFREADAVLALLGALAREPGCPTPQLVLIDGNGVLHGMGAGVACHVGVRSGIPTIGAAKTFFSVSGQLSGDAVKAACRRHLHARGDFLYLLGGGSQPLGAAVWASADGTDARGGAALSGSSRCCGTLSATGAFSSPPLPAAAAAAAAPAAAAAAAASAATAGDATRPLPGKGAAAQQIGCNPMFVSVGHGLTLSGALQLALLCCRFRVPEPVRLADKHSRHVMADLDSAMSRSVCWDVAIAAAGGGGIVATPVGGALLGHGGGTAVARSVGRRSEDSDGRGGASRKAASAPSPAYSGPGPAYFAPVRGSAAPVATPPPYSDPAGAAAPGARAQSRPVIGSSNGAPAALARALPSETGAVRGVAEMRDAPNPGLLGAAAGPLARAPHGAAPVAGSAPVGSRQATSQAASLPSRSWAAIARAASGSQGVSSGRAVL